MSLYIYIYIDKQITSSTVVQTQTLYHDHFLSVHASAFAVSKKQCTRDGLKRRQCLEQCLEQCMEKFVTERHRRGFSHGDPLSR